MTLTLFKMAEGIEITAESVPASHGIRDLTDSEADFQHIWQLWQTIFPKWPIERKIMHNLLYLLPGQHYIHDQGFCLSFLADGGHGKIAAVGVLFEHRGKGLGTAFITKAQVGLRNAARGDAGGGELKSLAIGSAMPRFWPQMPIDFPQDVKDFFIHRGKSSNFYQAAVIVMAHSDQVFKNPSNPLFGICTETSAMKSRRLKFSSKSQKQN